MHNRAHADMHPRQDTSNCQDPNPANTLTDRLNTLLNSSGPGYILSLCLNQQYLIEAPLLYTSPDKEISTSGYPAGDDRAILVVNGPVFNGTGHTTAVDAMCSTCSGARLRNIQVRCLQSGFDHILTYFPCRLMELGQVYFYFKMSFAV
jgi:hypothetical protein